MKATQQHIETVIQGYLAYQEAIGQPITRAEATRRALRHFRQLEQDRAYPARKKSAGARTAK